MSQSNVRLALMMTVALALGGVSSAMAGMQVLMKGGNAIESVAAVGAAVTMMEPQMNGLGGNGSMAVYEKKTGRVHSLAMTGAPEGSKAERHTIGTVNAGIGAGTVPEAIKVANADLYRYVADPVNVVEFQMPGDQAVESPRFVLEEGPNFYKPEPDITVTVERRVEPAALKTLEAWGTASRSDQTSPPAPPACRQSSWTSPPGR